MAGNAGGGNRGRGRVRVRLGGLERALAPPEPPGLLRVVRGETWDRVWWCPGGVEAGDRRALLVTVLAAGLWDLL